MAKYSIIEERVEMGGSRAEREVLRVNRALADMSRLRAVLALRDGELCVCQLIALLKLAPSTVSKHLSILHQAELIESRKIGRWVYYRLVSARSVYAAQMIRLATEALQDSAIVREDTMQLRSICNMKLEELCRRQSTP